MVSGCKFPHCRTNFVLLTKFAILTNLYPPTESEELQCLPPKNTLISVISLVHIFITGSYRMFTDQNFQRWPGCSEGEGKSLHFLTPILSRSCLASGIEANYIYSMMWHDLGIILIQIRFNIRMVVNITE